MQTHMYYTDKVLSQFRLRIMQLNDLFSRCNINLHKKIPEKTQVKSFYVQKKQKQFQACFLITKANFRHLAGCKTSLKCTV